MNRKLGRLLWLGKHLLEKAVPFRLRVMTGEGLLSADIREEEELLRQLDNLLCSPLAKEGSAAELPLAASWQYHIGGAPDEE